MRQELKRFDPFPLQNIRTVMNYQNEILDLFDEAEHVGVEHNQGHCYIQWHFIRGLEKDLISDFKVKIQEKVHTAFYARHIYSSAAQH